MGRKWRKRNKYDDIDTVMGKILQETYEEFEDELEGSHLVKDLYKDYFRFVYEIIKSGHFPRISIPKFGHLIPNPSKISKYCDNYTRKYGNDSDFTYLDKIDESINRIKEEDKKIKRK